MTLPISAVLLVAYFFAMDAARSPDSMAALIGSFLPPTAPMVMLGRMAYGGVPAWEIAVSILLMLGTIYAMLRIAGRVYAGAALRLGRRVKLRDAWRGAGLAGLSVQLSPEALGGSLVVRSGPGSGTSVSGAIPIAN